ncbi:hypothetical protein J3A83DRAFT_2536084 [Scleroderma citrinum]
MPPQLDIYTCITAVAYSEALSSRLLSRPCYYVLRQIELFWRKPKRSWTFALFIANRYITILGHVPQLIYSILSPATRADYTRVRCDSLLLASQVVIYVVQTIGGVVMTIRVYALYQNSRLVLVFLGAFMFVTIVLGCWGVFSPTTPSSLTMFVPPSQSTGNAGCPSGAYFSSRLAVYVAAVWSGQLVFDILVFLLTLVRSLQIRKESSRSIVDTLLWDGSLYFAVMCGINIANITILLVATNSLKGVASDFVNVISATLISRLMLNLRDPRATDPMDSSPCSLSHANMVYAVPPTGSESSVSVGELML